MWCDSDASNATDTRRLEGATGQVLLRELIANTELLSFHPWGLFLCNCHGPITVDIHPVSNVGPMTGPMGFNVLVIDTGESSGYVHSNVSPADAWDSAVEIRPVMFLVVKPSHPNRTRFMGHAVS